MLTLSWSDGNTLIPVNSCLLASAKTTNIIGPVKDFDNRTLAGKRRKLAQTKAPEAMMALLDTALSVGLNADYVLFDSWFSKDHSHPFKRHGCDCYDQEEEQPD